MPVINGKYYANPQYGRHVEEKSGKPSIAKELKKSKNQPSNVEVDPTLSPLFSSIPKRDSDK